MLMQERQYRDPRVMKLYKKARDLVASNPDAHYPEFTYTGTLSKREITVTPLMAAWLIVKRNGHNRNPSFKHIEDYAHAMTAGKWLRSCNDIGISQDGQVTNGGHRLYAALMSEVCPVLDFKIGLPPESFTIEDQGKTRTASDTLGIYGQRNTKMSASAAVILCAHERGIPLGQCNLITRHDAINFVLGNPPVEDAAAYIAGRRELHKVGPPRVLVACYFLFSRIDAAAAARFFEALETGANLHASSPILQLRNRLMNLKASPQGLGGTKALPYLIAVFFKTWKAWRKNENAGVKLVYDPGREQFPELD